MSSPLSIALVGATGLIGRTLIERSVGREDIRILAVARREMKLPAGAKMELVVAAPQEWGAVFERVRPDVLVSALGTTWSKAGKDEAAFRAVDQHLVLDTALAAKASGVMRMIAVSSAGADAASKNFYLRVKGEVERDLMKAGLSRLDILRPGLLRGSRRNDPRLGESLAAVVSPVMDMMLHGPYRKYRSVRAEVAADGILALALKKAAGRFIHDGDAIMRAANSLPHIARD
ncbi:NAD(P)H-binding protein [Pontixanthobacter sp.]|uniref:NAD(P)H-binding protein n=1 Tax=Pontixanthobacter sp. TaxID=2792078 RepID=UPI003C7A1E5E